MIIKRDKLIKVEIEDVKNGVLTIPEGVKKVKEAAFSAVMVYIVWDEQKERYVRKQDVKIKKLVLPRSLLIKEANNIHIDLLNAEEVVIADKQVDLTL